jgi:molybdopterin-binding protein
VRGGGVGGRPRVLSARRRGDRYGAPAACEQCSAATRSSLAGMKISARNQLSGTVTSVNEGAAIANVEVDVNGQRLVASITVEAARELGLKEGAAVTAIVKASDVLLATD